MPRTEATGRIRIVTVPHGEAPEEVRRAWVGLELPCMPYAGFVDGEEKGVLSNTPSPDSHICVLVPQDEALAILKEHSPEAAKWWADHGYPMGEDCFLFRMPEFAIGRGVEYQHLIEVTDEMRGDPNR